MEWNAIAGAAGAAEIRFINEVDGETIPPLPMNFKYMEAGYVL
jgi:hypothetical protein